MAKKKSAVFTAAKQRNKPPRGKPFVKGDARINRKGRPHVPKNIRELNSVIDEIFEEQEEIQKGKKIDKLRITINRLLLSPNPSGAIYILDRRFGKVKDEVVISSESIEQLLQYLPDDLLERIAQGEKIGDVLVEWIANLRESKTNSARKG